MTVKANLELVVERQSVRGHDGLSEAGVAAIPNDAEAWWRVSLEIIQGAVLQHPCIMHRPRELDEHVHELGCVVTDSLKLNGTKKCSIQVTGCVLCWLHHRDVAAINAANNPVKGC